MADVWHALADPWREPLIRRAFLEVALIGVTGGTLGCWVVLYGLSYGAESLAHGLFPGLTASVMGLMNRLLPAAGGIGTQQRLGRDSESAVAPSFLTALTEAAARRNNEVPAT